MKYLLNVLTATAILTGTSALAQDAVFFTGGVDGDYESESFDIRDRLAQRNVEIEVENRNGSDDITIQACSAEVPAMWIAQKDALYIREMEQGCTLVDIALYGNEYAMLFFPPNSRDDKLSDLDGSDTVLVDKIGSGSELTWRNMVNIESEHGGGDEWSTARIETDSPRRATSMASRGTISAVFLVRTLESGDVTSLLSQGWELGYMYDKDINDLQWNNGSLYEDERIDIVRDGRRQARNWSYVVPSFIGTTTLVERNHPKMFDEMISAAY